MTPDYRIGPEAFKYFQSAYQHQMRGEFEAAVADYKKSLAIEPTAEAYTFLGWTYSKMGDLDAAIEMCHKAIAVDPDFGNPYNDIGAYQLQLGQLEAAIPWLQKAKKAPRYENPEFPYCNLAKLYELRGLWPLALQEYLDALKLRPDYEPARVSAARLASLLN
jgi:tetratricopeptide (TPR) repeat protein